MLCGHPSKPSSHPKLHIVPPRRNPWWDLRGHPEERPPWGKMTLMRDHPEEKPPWAEMTLRDDLILKKKPLWGETTLITDHPEQRWPCLKLSLLYLIIVLRLVLIPIWRKQIKVCFYVNKTQIPLFPSHNTSSKLSHAKLHEDKMANNDIYYIKLKLRINTLQISWIIISPPPPPTPWFLKH